VTAPNPLFILAANPERARMFVADEYLMPDRVVIVGDLDKFRGRHKPTVLRLPGCQLTQELDGILRSRFAVMLGPDDNLDEWRKPLLLLSCRAGCGYQWRSRTTKAPTPDHFVEALLCVGSREPGRALITMSAEGIAAARAVAAMTLPALQTVPPKVWTRLVALPGLKVRHELEHNSWVRVNGGQVTVGHAGVWQMAQYPAEGQDSDD
jgi:hypothetical protein